jgi:hypothetical protein
LEIWWEYLETARTLFRAAQTMTDRAIAGQLKALADDYERRAEKASHVDAAKHSLDRMLTPKASGWPADLVSEQQEATGSDPASGPNTHRSDGALLS